MTRLHLTLLVSLVVLVAGFPADGVQGQELRSIPGIALDNGDVNGDLSRDVSDGISLLQFLFSGGRAPVPLALCGTAVPTVQNGDVNADSIIDMSDAISLLTWLYAGTAAPVDCCGDGTGGARNVNPRIIPVQAIPHGMSYGEWAAAWWQWALSMPASAHPLTDTADCSEGQSGHVWFLGGSFASATAERDCTVPEGTFLFLPIINAECSNLEPPPFACDDEPSCLACNDAIFTEDDVLSLTVDGVEVTNLQSFRVQSGVFEIGPLPADSVFGLPEGTTGISLTDGYYVMLAPLSAGEHRIDIRGCFDVFGGCPGFELIIGYNITVE